MSDRQPWQPVVATRRINEMAKDLSLDLYYTEHALIRIDQRNLILSDLLYLLRNGFVVCEEPEQSTQKGLYKYLIDGKTPNSDARYLRIVVIPDEKSNQIKVVTAMWRDES